MERRATWFALLAGLLYSGLVPASKAAGMTRPAEIRSYRHEILPEERYAELAKQWEAYVTANPKDPTALVEWGDALRYTGHWNEGVAKYREAVALDSTSVPAIVALAASQVTTTKGLALARDRLTRAMRIAPDFPDTYYSLWTAAVLTGEDELARTCLARMVSTGDMPHPLLEFGANLVEGAPPNAIIFTNGDNDTYPPLAWQQVTGRRTDVTIVNLSLLNLADYARALRTHGVPLGTSEEELAAYRPSEKATLSRQLQPRIRAAAAAAAANRPVRIAVTVPSSSLARDDEHLVVEGLLQRLEAGPPAPGSPRVAGDRASGREGEEAEFDREQARKMLDTVYRLEGMTDPTVAWDRESVLGRLALNYVSLLMEVGRGLCADGEDGDAYYYRAAHMLAVQRNPEMGRKLLDDWGSACPDPRLLATARRLFAD